MVSKRTREKRTIGNRIVRLESQNNEVSSIAPARYLETDVVDSGALATDSVREEHLSPQSVNTEHLGLIREIKSDDRLTVYAPGGLYVDGGGGATTGYLLRALPEPQTVTYSNTQAITAASWTAIPNLPTVTLILPYACWITLQVSAWTSAASGDVRMGASVSGATTLIPNEMTPGGVAHWGVTAINAGVTVQTNAIRTVKLNAGTNIITGSAYRTGAGAVNTNYPVLSVIAVRWAQ